MYFFLNNHASDHTIELLFSRNDIEWSSQQITFDSVY